MSDQIIKLLAKSSAQKPMQFNTLLDETGLLPKTLNMILDSMYAAHSINQATVTRNGVEQREVWPTGVVGKAPGKDIVVNPNFTRESLALSKPPRRNENPIIKTSQATETQASVELTAINTESENIMETQTDKPKSKALLMLEHIENHPHCTIADLTTAAKEPSPKAYIKKHLERGHVICHSLEGSQRTYTLLEGLTANDIFSGRARKAVVVSPENPSSKSESLSSIDGFPEDIKMHFPCSHLSDQEIKIIAETSNPEKIRVGYEGALEQKKIRYAMTSDQTIILFGLTYEAIELSQAQTKELINFCDSASLMLPDRIEIYTGIEAQA